MSHRKKKEVVLDEDQIEQKPAEKVEEDVSYYWADDKQSKARNSDGKYRQMALVGFWYIHLRFCVRLGTVLTMQSNVRWPWPFSYINLS